MLLAGVCGGEGGVKEKEQRTNDKYFSPVTEQPLQFCRSSMQLDAH